MKCNLKSHVLKFSSNYKFLDYFEILFSIFKI
jgi:hypothetical protein